MFNLSISVTFANSRTDLVMAKAGKQKNTKNKAKHAKLMDRKKKKLREEKLQRAARLKAVVNAVKEKQSINPPVL